MRCVVRVLVAAAAALPAFALALGAEVTPTATPTPPPSVELPPELARVLTDYESAWRARDASALARLFAEDGFVLSAGRPPVRGRAAIEKHYAGAGGQLALRAFAYRTEGRAGYILGGYAWDGSTTDRGKFTLTLVRGEDGRWLIFSDMDNANQR
jgi:ketosteroid isomerase-like protein